MPKFSDSSIKKQTPRNLAVNGITFLTTVLVGMWLVPYLRTQLGSAGYGLIPVALGVISYIAILVQSLNRSISRFLAIDIQREDNDAALRTFNTSYRLLLAVCAIHLPVLMLGTWAAVRYLNIPAALLHDAIYLFFLTFMAFFISVFSTIYRTSLSAHNRLDLQRIIELVRVLVRAGMIVGLFAWWRAGLAQVGWAGLTAAVAELLLSRYFCHRLTPELVYVHGSYDRVRRQKLLNMGKWMIVQSAGGMLLLKVNLIIVNVTGSAEMAGDYAPCLMIADVIRNVTALMAGIIWPVIMLTYARKQTERLQRILHLSVRGLGAIVAIPVGIACGMAGPFLSLWIGQPYAAYGLLLVLLLFHQPLNLAVSPLNTVQSAYNRVKVPAIAICVLAIFHVALASWMARTHLGPMLGVALASAVTWTLKDMVFGTLYTTYIMKNRWYSYAEDLFRVALFLLTLGVISYAVRVWIPVTSWPMLLLLCSTIGALALPTGWFFLLAPNERALCREMVRLQFCRSGWSDGLSEQTKQS